MTHAGVGILFVIGVVAYPLGLAVTRPPFRSLRSRVGSGRDRLVLHAASLDQLIGVELRRAPPGEQVLLPGDDTLGPRRQLRRDLARDQQPPMLVGVDEVTR